jgi:ankyrin repeat protein
MYVDTIGRIQNGQDRAKCDLAMRVLMLLSYALRPLKLAEIQQALLTIELEPDETNIDDKEDVYDKDLLIAVCFGIVILENETSVIRFVHHTAETYFESNRESLFKGGHVEFAKICIKYLSFDDFENGPCQTDYEFEERLQAHSFYRYAAKNWGHHARAGSSSCQAVVEFFHKQAQVEGAIQGLMATKRWPGDMSYSQDSTKGVTSLHLAAFFGVNDAVKAFWIVSPHSKDWNGRTPLHIATMEGHEAIVRLLLEIGQVDIDSKDNDRQSPLWWAIYKGHEAIVKLLLQTGQVDIDLKDKYDRTPLYIAAMEGHEAIVRLLLETGQVDIDSKDIDRQSPLWWAAYKGHEAIVKLLLETGQVDIDSKDRNGRTPLHIAAMEGHEAIVKLLLETGQVDTDSKDNYKRSILWWAAYRGHKTIVKLLLKP